MSTFLFPALRSRFTVVQSVGSHIPVNLHLITPRAPKSLNLSSHHRSSSPKMSSGEVIELTNREKSGTEYEVHDVNATDDKGETSAHSRVQTQLPVLAAKCLLVSTFRLTYSSQRYITFLPTLAFGGTLQFSWESICGVFAAGLLNGGPV